MGWVPDAVCKSLRVVNDTDSEINSLDKLEWVTDSNECVEPEHHSFICG